MTIKRKAFGFGLLTVMAVGAFAVVNASATSSATGHFTSDAPSGTTKLDFKENAPNGPHLLVLTQAGFTGIVCHETTYTGHLTGATVTDITITPTYKGCLTTGGATGSVTVHTNGCSYTFTQPNIESAKTEHTVDLVCPAGKKIEITHATCTVGIAPVTIKGYGYTTISEQAPGSTGGAKHAITITSSATFPMTRHGGFCSLLATNATGSLSGSMTVFGTDNNSGAQVNITATGSIN
jgi:hypothetical protein